MESRLFNKNLSELLARNGFVVVVQNNSYTIHEKKGRGTKTTLYFVMALAAVLAGTVFLYLGFLLYAAVVLASAIPMFASIWKVFSRQVKARGRLITIDGEYTILTNERDSVKIPNYEIKGIVYNFEKGEDMSMGSIEYMLGNNVSEEVIEIYGDDPRYVREDIQNLATKLQTLYENLG